MTKFVYIIFYLISLLPLRVLYAFSDVLAFIAYHIIGYRRGVVRRNLTTSFPEKSLSEIKKIEKANYRWFCDYFFEAIKLLSISDKELRRRLVINNSDEIEACFREGQDCSAILGHYGNWEWLSCVGIDLPQDSRVLLIYHPLRNKAFDELFKKIRSHEPTGDVVPKKDILRRVIGYKQKNVRTLSGYISDQGPKWENIHLWLPFLNHPETPVFTGGERIMRKMNQAVFYMEMNRPKRGYYVGTYHLISKDPASLPPNEITRRFFQMLEATIQKDPTCYLWTHDRWKRTREEFDRRYEVVNGKVVPKHEEA